METLSCTARRAALALLAACATCAALAQADDKACAMVLLHGKGASPQSLAALARKLKPACTPRPLEMPWSERRAVVKDYPAALKDIAAQVKELRRQGYKRVLVVGQGLGANAGIAYAGEVGDVEGVVALAPVQDSQGLGDLPATTARIPQHVPLLWVIGARDPLFALGEAYAYGKAPPHPQGRYVVVQADHAGTAEAAVKPVLEWIKALE